MANNSLQFQLHLLADPPDALMNLTFESLAERLQVFDRMYFEMDGSFVWTGDAPGPWQVDGMVYDIGQQIQRVEIKGHCDLSQWHKLLQALGYPDQPLTAYDLQSAQFQSIPQLEARLWSA